MGPVRTYTAQQQQRKEWRYSRALPGKSRNRPSRFLYASYLRPVVYSFFLFFVLCLSSPLTLLLCSVSVQDGGNDQKNRNRRTQKPNAKKPCLISFPFSAYSFVIAAVHINRAIQRWRKCNNAAGE
jgi:ABC-type Fe3+ transport system permease subunit